MLLIPPEEQVRRKTETLQWLLRQETAAVETYRQAHERAAARWTTADPRVVELRRLGGEHRDAAGVLRQLIIERGGEPVTGPGIPWEWWAEIVQGIEDVFGPTALQALKSGEESLARAYERALQDEHLDDECKKVIQNTLASRQREHIPALGALPRST